ncbi:MAG: hypothetical protein JXQ73_20785 [Phycisphaerae bacterium]|nr:hypothetical protein [Phycisphaerae bacterium]
MASAKTRKRNPYRTFEGPALAEIAFPLGGIGTGTVSLGGYGNLRDWEIFNRPSKGLLLPYTFFAIRCRPRGARPITRVLEARRRPPYTSSHGLAPAQVMGLPRLARATVQACYPLITVRFRDKHLPVRVELEAFNPFIPLNEKDSGLPVAVLRYTVTNPGKRLVDVSVVGSLQNAVGQDGQIPRTACCGPAAKTGLGANRNEYVELPNLAGLRMTGSKYAPDQPPFGSMALATLYDGQKTYLTDWAEPGWWDACQRFWDDFSDDGRLDNARASGDPSPDGQTHQASLGCIATIPPRAKRQFTFLIAWHFPNRVNTWNTQAAVAGKIIRNWYATQFNDAWDVCRYVADEFDRLESQTRRFVDTLAAGTLPPAVIDAAGSQASTIRTNTCFRAEDGRFYGFEGCSDHVGCCPMNCTHVWNYEQAVAHLFPTLERTMRLTDFEHNTEDDGFMTFRTLVPLCEDLRGSGDLAAADGQMGCLLKLYREWQLSGDRQWLARLYPHAKRALEYAFNHDGAWDADRDGVMEGVQHNTYDIEFRGPNPMMSALYLGALRAMAAIAREMNDPQAADDYDKLFASGSAKLDQTLWNGAYYVQKDVDVTKRKYQFGQGCLTDQLLGQWFCHVAGLGHVLRPKRVRKALRSIFKHNFRESLADHASVQRAYALNDEAGLLLCTWPNGGRPPFPFPYADEVWTGCEYQLAAHLIYEGLVDQGLRIVQAVRDRHDGLRRNPWNEFECGSHYARAMSSWSLLTALSGFAYSAPEQRISFAPRITPRDFRCLFTTGSAWGLFTQKQKARTLTATIDVRYGELPLRQLDLTCPGAKRPPGRCKLSQGKRSLDVEVHRQGAGLALSPYDVVTVVPDSPLRIVVEKK